MVYLESWAKLDFLELWVFEVNVVNVERKESKE